MHSSRPRAIAGKEETLTEETPKEETLVTSCRCCWYWRVCEPVASEKMH